MRFANEPVIVGIARTPIGSFLGTLSSEPAPTLAGVAIRHALADAKVDPSVVTSLFVGHVLSAGCGQHPARQAARAASLPDSTAVLSVNKVCASGLSAISIAATQVAAGETGIIVAAGMENMSLAPHLASLRSPTKFGPATFLDSLSHDGLRDADSGVSMGDIASSSAASLGVSRADQDEFALRSYRRAIRAFDAEEMPQVKPYSVSRPRQEDALLSRDEDLLSFRPEKFSKLRPSFGGPDGTITPANASSINDGAAAVVVCARATAERLGLTIRARILSDAHSGGPADHFPTAPVAAIREALDAASQVPGVPSGRMQPQDLDCIEINEAFSSQVLSCLRILGVPDDSPSVNPRGGAVAMGHPLGCSGARVVVDLVNNLERTGGSEMEGEPAIGVAAVCNGGGGASALVLQLC
jgi:acetyl-CoA C-acetyltransferase